MTYLVFFNKTGNRKIALEFDEKITVSDIDEKLASVIDCICKRNDYTFSFYNESRQDVIKNLPILNIDALNL